MGLRKRWHKMAQNPANQLRLRRFRSHRRGYWSLWIFLVLFTLSLAADLIANDQPLLIRSQGQFFWPLLNKYQETDFGGDLPLPANYRDPYLVELINADGWMIWPPIPYSYQTINYDLPQPAPSPPSRENLLGTDDQGRDLLTRLIYGFRISVLFALALTITSSVIGIIYGAMQGYYGGRFDLFSQRFMEIWSGMPVLFLLIILSSLIQPGFIWLLGIMLLFSWMSLVDVVRAEFLRGRNLEYVRAAQALGLANATVMFRHILPNAMVATLTFMPFIFTGALTTLTALDFLGFGMPPGSPSLGEMIQQGKNNLQAPWIGLTAFFSLSIILVLLIFIGEAVRDAFDPRIEQAEAGR